MLKFSDPAVADLDYTKFYKSTAALSNLTKTSTKTATRVTKIDPKNFIYTAVVGLNGDEWNANWDYLPNEELLAEVTDKIANSASNNTHKFAWQTWIGQPNPRNHKLEDAAKDSFGFVADAHYCPTTKNLYMLLATDRLKDPSLARAIELKLQNAVSAGWSVTYSKCSYCEHKAYKEGDYCEHIEKHKGRFLPALKSPKPDWIKFCQANYPNVVENGQVRVGEICYGIRGIEESWVVNPAFPKARVIEVLKTAQAKTDLTVVREFLKTASVPVSEIDGLLSAYPSDHCQVLGENLFKASKAAERHSETKHRGIYGNAGRNPSWSK